MISAASLFAGRVSQHLNKSISASGPGGDVTHTRFHFCLFTFAFCFMLRVGLTGSIAVGKSFVAATLAGLGCRVLDADLLARAVVEPGQEGLKAVIEAFGAEVVAPDGRLDRARLGAIIFADEKRRQLLNSILHPLIIAAQDEQLHRWEREDRRGIAVVDAALMIESGSFRRFE